MTTRYGGNATRRRTRKAVPQPDPKHDLVGLTDQQKVERMPHFGPGLKIRVPLHLWPAYQRAYQLEVLKPNPDREARTLQTALFVKRVADARDPDLWQCLECADQPELVQPEMIAHMEQVHRIDTKNATGTKNLIMAADGAGFYHHTWEYNIDGMKFLRYHHGEKRK